jgi:hypothetical protein
LVVGSEHVLLRGRTGGRDEPVSLGGDVAQPS